VIDDVKRDFSFSNVYKYRQALDDGNIYYACKLMNIESTQIEQLNQFLFLQKWTEGSDSIEKVRAYLTEDEFEEYVDVKKTYDPIHDFDAYYPDFLRYFNIDLLNSDISYFQFEWCMNALVSYEDSAIGKRIQYRGYTSSKGEDPKYRQYMESQRSKYSFVAPKKKSLSETIMATGKRKE